MSEKVERGVIFTFMRKALRNSLSSKERRGHYDLITQVLRQMVDADLIDPPRAGDYSGFYGSLQYTAPDIELAKLLNECYTALLIRGIIIPEPKPPNYGDYSAWNNYEITEYGREWVNSEDDPIPEDTKGYLDFIKKKVTVIDDVVLQYVSEALNTYDAGFLFASAVMLGAAAEKITYLLAESIKTSTTDAKLRDEITKALNSSRNLPALRGLVTKGLCLDNPKQSKIPYEVHEESGLLLMALFNAIRIQRNAAVHPVAVRVSASELRLLLISFPHACRKAYDFINWLATNKI